MTVLRGNWNYPTSIKFGAGRIAELPEHCRALGMRRPLLVTDAGLATLPMIASAISDCRDAGLGCELFIRRGTEPAGSPRGRRPRCQPSATST